MRLFVTCVATSQDQSDVFYRSLVEQQIFLVAARWHAAPPPPTRPCPRIRGADRADLLQGVSLEGQSSVQILNQALACECEAKIDAQGGLHHPVPRDYCTAFTPF